MNAPATTPADVETPDPGTPERATFDPATFDPATFDLGQLAGDDPYTLFDALRATGPMVRTIDGFLVVLSYDSVDAVFKDGRFSSGLIAERYRAALPPGAARDELSHRINFLDPPDHPRVRGLISRAFTPARIHALRPWVEEKAEALLDEIDPDALRDGGVDLRAALAHTLPSLVISEMLGVPIADRDELTELTEAVTPLLGVHVPPDEKARALEASETFAAYAAALVDEQRRAPGDDLLSAMLAADDADDTLSREELLSLVVTLYSAGHRTNRDLFTNGLRALIEHPDQYAVVHADPSRAPAAINEFLRYQTPTLYVARVPMEPTELLGEPVDTFTPTLLMLAAANRDPQRFSDPHRFDIARDEGAPLSFAFGPHHCLGASLARMEAEVMLIAVTRRWPTLDIIDPPPTWWSSGPFRGLTHLQVSPPPH